MEKSESDAFYKYYKIFSFQSNLWLMLQIPYLLVWASKQYVKNKRFFLTSARFMFDREEKDFSLIFKVAVMTWDRWNNQLWGVGLINMKCAIQEPLPCNSNVENTLTKLNSDSRSIPWHCTRI